ncbi:hypothetical protein ACB092_03G181000 [Castanea dentata]
MELEDCTCANVTHLCLSGTIFTCWDSLCFVGTEWERELSILFSWCYTLVGYVLLSFVSTQPHYALHANALPVLSPTFNFWASMASL